MKIVVIDDDPTGSQTVHNCPLYLHWDVDSLRLWLQDSSPLIFLLANTRALSPDDAARCNRSIAFQLDQALKAEGLDRRDVLLVSRGDSTLRGHGFLEPYVLADCFGPFDATFHCPAFLEGGRTTVDGIHFVHGVPVHTTAFAGDARFGFSTSYLPSWLECKSDYLLSEHLVERISISELNSSSVEALELLVNRLRTFKDNVSVVLDAECPEQLSRFASAVHFLRREKRFLFRSAASLVKALASLGPSSLSTSCLADFRRRDSNGRPLPGLVMVGSYVPLADSQLQYLLAHPMCVGLEIPVHKFASVLDCATCDLMLNDLEQNWLARLRSLLVSGMTPVLFSGRGELRFGSDIQSRRFSRELASLMSRLAAAIAPDLGYLISKGGTTSQTLLAEGLSLSSVHLEGQLLPGLSLVRPTEGNLSGLPILTFPGNLGLPHTLFEAWQLMEASGRS